MRIAGFLLSQFILCVVAQEGTTTSPTFRADVVAKTLPAINYRVLGGETGIDVKPTDLLPMASGSAQVKSRQNVAEIDALFTNLTPPTQFGAEYLTYVLWAISPDGTALNIGEVLPDKEGRAKVDVTAQMQVFALVVTAEPYFAVRVPSDLIVLQNEVRKKVKGRVFMVDAKTELLPKGEYARMANPLGLAPDLRSQPLEVYEARNAIHIATSFGADQHANDGLERARDSLQAAEGALTRGADRKDVITLARESVQFAEESRQLAVTRQAEALAAATKAKAEAEEQLHRQAEAERARAEASERAEAEVARQKALAAQAEASPQAEIANASAEQAHQAAEQAEREKLELRRRLLQQFNEILETRDTARGLVVNIGDVLFAFGTYDLKDEAKLGLARLAGNLISYPGLALAVEGHTDDIGTETFNQKLSEQRAAVVQDFMVGQGIPASRVQAVGLGMSRPVDSNDTVASRQRNRRVEIVVSGDVIGEKID